MQNVNGYTLCAKQPKRWREGVWKITEKQHFTKIESEKFIKMLSHYFKTFSLRH